MPSRNLPEGIDKDRLAEAALAILSLTLHVGGRVRSKAKSVVLTEDGERLAHEFLQKYFGSP